MGGGGGGGAAAAAAAGGPTEVATAWLTGGFGGEPILLKRIREEFNALIQEVFSC